MSSARPLGKNIIPRPAPGEIVDAIRAAAAQGMHCAMIARALHLHLRSVQRIVAREGIDVVRGRPGPQNGSKRRQTSSGISVPGWVPRGLASDYIASAKLYGEEKAASIVRRLKAEAVK